MEAHVLSPQEKIEFVKAAINDVQRGLLVAIPCPYCAELNEQGNPICCLPMALCIQAILGEYEAQKQVNMVRRITANVEAQRYLDEHAQGNPFVTNCKLD